MYPYQGNTNAGRLTLAQIAGLDSVEGDARAPGHQLDSVGHQAADFLALKRRDQHNSSHPHGLVDTRTHARTEGQTHSNKNRLEFTCPSNYRLVQTSHLSSSCPAAKPFWQHAHPSSVCLEPDWLSVSPFFFKSSRAQLLLDLLRRPVTIIVGPSFYSIASQCCCCCLDSTVSAS